MKSCESWMVSYLLNSLWQIPVLFAAGWAAMRVLRKFGAEAEHRVWVSVLLLQCLLPALPALPWEWLHAHLAWGGDAYQAGEARVSVTMGAGTGLGALHLPALWLSAVAIAYGVVIAYFASRFAWRWMRLSAMRREAVEMELSGEAALVWARCARSFGVSGASIATSAQIFGPLTMGVSRKLVALPLSMAAGLPEAEFHAVIAHEFAHMRRQDFLKNLIYELLALPVNYHPLFWLTRDRVMESREMVCDRMAAEVAGRREYARSLLRLASLLLEGKPVRVANAIGIFDANTLERRVMKLTEKQYEVRGTRRVAAAVVFALLGVGVSGSALAVSMHVDALSAVNDRGSKADRQINVSAAVMAANKLSGPVPKYPEEAKKAKIQGAVVLSAVIGKDGVVEELTVVSGPKELQQSSLDAVRQWIYKPFLLNGEPVEVKTTINVIYSLQK